VPQVIGPGSARWQADAHYPTVDPGRRAHYGDFYDGPPHAGPVALVHGNCQAEALRVALAPSTAERMVRVPPAHELTADDIEPLRALLARTTLLVSQPVRDDYRDLPIGTRQLARLLPRAGRVLRVPIVRYLGLHPYAAIVRHAADRAAVPPVVPYHDLRTVAVAAGRPKAAPADAAALRAVGVASVAELARREHAGCDVKVSDLLEGLGVDAVHTLNHPGNRVVVALACRVHVALGGTGEVADPGRTLLGEVVAPLEPAVLAARGLTAAPREHWILRGQTVTEETVRAAHLAWYADHPEWVAAALTTHADRIALLGL
jgi:hypothetical protein